MKSLLHIAFLLAAALPAAFSAAFSAHARESFQAAVTPSVAPHPSQYSFADVYRLTVVGQAPALPQVSESPMRVAAAQPGLVSEAQFRVSSVREPQRWALLIAGLMLAGWVARRRIDTLL